MKQCEEVAELIIRDVPVAVAHLRNLTCPELGRGQIYTPAGATGPVGGAGSVCPPFLMTRQMRRW